MNLFSKSICLVTVFSMLVGCSSCAPDMQGVPGTGNGDIGNGDIGNGETGDGGNGGGTDVDRPFPGLPSAEEAAHWWPVQKEPSKVVVCHCGNTLPEQMLAQSLSGLAAQAVNEGLADEMVWIYRNDPDYQLWFERMNQQKNITVAGELSTEELLERYVTNGIVKGYVLYRQISKGSSSINPATTVAAMKKAILIEEDLEEKAVSLGLRCLADAREMTEEEVLQQYKKEINRHMLVALEPKLSNIRDFAIAHKALCVFGTGEFETMVMEWLKPFSPIFGWNKGDEYVKTSLASRYGHFIVPSSLCYNMSYLCAGSETVPVTKCKSIDPKTITYDKEYSYHSFVMSDGDNFRYATSNFFYNTEYWANPYSKTIPMTWGLCPVSMIMGNPYSWNEIVADSYPASLLEFGGGYHYPDEFALQRKNREAHQRLFARIINEHFQTAGVKVLGNIYKDRNSPAAQQAMKIFAEEIDGLVGLIALSYNPYEDGKGEIRWVKNKQGVEIPVLYPKYSLWAGTKAPYKGNPEKISDFINRDAAAGQNFNASIIHAWSHYVKGSDGHIHDAEKNESGSVAGVEPVQWTKERLDPNVRTVTLEELLWRIRMDQRESETRKVIGY